MDTTKIVLAIVAAIAAALVGGIVWKINVSKKSRNSKTVVTQKNNLAGGDIVGGNKITKK
jgi:hypothetical protein